MNEFNIVKNANDLLLTLSNRDLLALIGADGVINRFKLSSGTYSIFKGKEGNLLISNKSSTGKTIPLSKFLIDDIGIAKGYKELIELINSKNFTPMKREEKKNKLNQKELIGKFKNSLIEYDLNNQFFENKLISKLQLKPLANSYKMLIDEYLYFNNTNILLTKKVKKLSNFKPNKINRFKDIGKKILRGENLELIISNHLENRAFNCRFKPSGQKWRTIKGGSNSGFYFKNPNNKKTICYIAEGANDGINTFLTTGYDVFAIDSKNSIPNELIELIETKEYKQFRILNDRDDNKIFEAYQYKISNFKNISFLNWDEIIKEFPNLPSNADITDILNTLFESGKTQRDIKREINKFIKDKLISLESVASDERLKSYQKRFKYYKDNHKIKSIKKLLIDVYFEKPKSNKLEIISLFGEICEFLITHRIKFKFSEKMTIKKFLMENKKEVLKFIQKHKMSLINSPAGSGKSTFIRWLAKIFKVLIVTPVKRLTNEFEVENVGLLDKHKNDIELEADLIGFKTKKMSMVMTTERFIIDYKKIKELLINTNYFDFIVFDEQHLVNQAFNFRYSIIKTHYILKLLSKKEDFKANIVYATATPVNFDNTDYALLEVNRLEKTQVDYEISNETLNIIMNQKLKTIAPNESILMYCGATESVKEITRYLRAGNGEIEEKIEDIKIEDKNTIVIYDTSKESYFYENDTKIALNDDFSNIPKDKKVIYVATSKVATGVNLKGLKHLLQYGAVYNPENVIQLHSRLRENGSITVIPIKNNFRADRKRDKVIGLINTLTRFTLKYKINSIKELIRKFPSFIKELKQVSDLKEVSINSLYKNFKEELVSLNFFNLLKLVPSVKNEIWSTEDIIIYSNNTVELINVYNEIELNKEVDYILAEYATYNIKTFNSFYNTSQNFNIINESQEKVKKFKTIENKEELKVKKEETKTNKEIEINKYFEHFTSFNDYEQEWIIKLFKDVSIANITKFIDKAIEKNQDYIRAKFELIRTSKDMKIFISFQLGVASELKKLLFNDFEYREYVTVKELVEIYTQKGYKLSARGSFKDEIQHLAEDIEVLTVGKWEYVKNSYINNKKIRNVIKRAFSKDEIEVLKALKQNQVKDISNFIKFSGKNINQLINTFKEERGLFFRVVEEYLDNFKQ